MSRLTRCVRMRRYAIGGISVVAGECLHPLERPTQAAGIPERIVEQRLQRTDSRGRRVEGLLRRKKIHFPVTTLRQISLRPGLARPQGPSCAGVRRSGRRALNEVPQANFRSPLVWNVPPGALPAPDEYSRGEITLCITCLTKRRAFPAACIAHSASDASPQGATENNFTKPAQAAARKQAFAGLVCVDDSRWRAHEDPGRRHSAEPSLLTGSESREAHGTDFHAERIASFRPLAMYEDSFRAAPGRIPRGRVVPSRRERKCERAAQGHPRHGAIPPIGFRGLVDRRIPFVWRLVAFRFFVASGCFLASPGVEDAGLFPRKAIRSSLECRPPRSATDLLRADGAVVAGLVAAENEVRACAMFSVTVRRSRYWGTHHRHRAGPRGKDPKSVGHKVRVPGYANATSPEKKSPRAFDPKSSGQAGMTLPPAPIRLRPGTALCADSTRDSNAKAQTIPTTPAKTPLDIRAAAGCRSWDRLLCF
jgi:hypothetical protein